MSVPGCPNIKLMGKPADPYSNGDCHGQSMQIRDATHTPLQVWISGTGKLTVTPEYSNSTSCQCPVDDYPITSSVMMLQWMAHRALDGFTQ
jgi:hypothetical protein